jgi:endonuclease-8
LSLEAEARRTLDDMPEGDTIHYAAGRIRPVLEGHVPDELATPHARFARDRWPERLAGRAVRSVDAHGKHLFLRFEGDLTIHSHLRMTGSWRVFAPGQRWTRSPRAAWLVLRRGGSEVVQFNGPVLELMTESRTRFDRRIAGLGPDILAPEFDYERFLRRLREDDPTRPIGDAVLEQRTVAGIGNMWKVEACFEAGIDPWRPLGKVSDDEAVAIVDAARPRMQQSARDGNQDRHKRVHGRAGLPCPRCGADSLIRAKGQWDDNRLTFWCPRCQS